MLRLLEENCADEFVLADKDRDGEETKIEKILADLDFQPGLDGGYDDLLKLIQPFVWPQAQGDSTDSQDRVTLEDLYRALKAVCIIGSRYFFQGCFGTLVFLHVNVRSEDIIWMHLHCLVHCMYCNVCH